MRIVTTSRRTTRLRSRTARAFAALGLLAGVCVPVLSSPARAVGQSEVSRAGTLPRIGRDAIELFGERIVPPHFFDEIGTLPRQQNGFDNANTGTLLMFPEVRQLWQIHPFTNADFTKGTAIAVRDLDTLKLQRGFTLDLQLDRGTPGGGGGEWMHAVDRGKRVFLVGADLSTIVEVDLASLATTRYTFQPTGSVSSRATGMRLGGISYDRHADALIGVFGHVAALNVANLNTVLFRRELKTGTTATRQVRSCTGPLPSTDTSNTYGIPLIAAAEFLYVPCHRTGQSGAVVRLPRASAFDVGGPEDLSVGPVGLEAALADEASGRMFLVTQRGEVWAFDTATMSFVGVISAHPDTPTAVLVSYGLDPDTGRLYFQSKAYGFGIAEGRFFPIPQARTFPDRPFQGQERIMSDARTGRVFVLEGYFEGKPYDYTILQTDPAPVPPPPPDPDRNTLDRAEQAGVTESRYFASASGYGARVLFANGVNTVAPAPGVGVVTPTAEAMSKYVSPKCGFTDRELFAGRVAKAEYDTGSTAAEAAAVTVDDATKLDLERPSRCDVNVRDGKSEVFRGIFATAPPAADAVDNDGDPRWNRDPATCSSSEGGEAARDAGDDHGQTPLGVSTVACPLPGGRLEASAEAQLVGDLTVGRAWSQAEVFRDDKGVHARSLSVARDVGFGPISVAEVRSVAESVSNGRPPKGPMSTHSIRIKGLIVNGVSVCEQCDPAQAVELMNQAAAGRAQFRIAGGIDPGLLRGSSKGALTAVQKAPQRQASDQSLVGDFTTEVPGLEIITYNDNTQWGRARQLYQLAGVATSGTYNIVTAGSSSPLLPGAAPVDFPDDPLALLGDELPASDSDGRSTVALPAVDDGGVIDRLYEAVADAARAVAHGLRLFFSNPRMALLLMTAWTLLAMPAVLARRRALLPARIADELRHGGRRRT